MIRFGLNVSKPATSGADPISDAVRAEELGFDFVTASDHLHGEAATFEPWTLLSSIAASTTRLHVASRVLAIPYRHPAVLAKMAETLDRLSGGRLILGLGGGYVDDEFRSFGIGAPSPREKIDGLDEAVRIVRGLWSEPELTFSGRRYRTEGARVEPKPARPIPIWLGTYGTRALEVTGRLADGWIPSLGFAPPEVVVDMRARVLAAARRAGRDPEAITCVYNLEVRVGDRVDEPPSVVAGAPGAIAERLIGFLGLGFTAMNLIVVGPEPEVQVEALAGEVLPAVRDAAR